MRSSFVCPVPRRSRSPGWPSSRPRSWTIGGYALQWHWTGYAGNTVWGWLGILLPLVFPTLLLPPLLKWVSGNAAGRASAGYQTATARKAIAAARTLP